MKSWIVIPAMGAVSAAAVIAVTRDPFAIAAAGLAGAALASCVRAISGITPAAIAAAVLAPLLVIASFAEHQLVDVNACLAVAAIAWTIALLARTEKGTVPFPQIAGDDLSEKGTVPPAQGDDVSDSRTGSKKGTVPFSRVDPLVALLPAIAAAVIEPAAVALVAIVGARIASASRTASLGDRTSASTSGDRTVTGARRVDKSTRTARVDSAVTGRVDSAPVRIDSAAIRTGLFDHERAARARHTRAKWAVAIPIAGGLAVMLALVAGMATDGVFATLGVRWFGPATQSTPTELAYRIADAIGPLTAVAALAGIAMIAKLRLGEVAALSCVAGALLVDLRAGTVGAATLGMAGLLAALAIGRLAATIRMPPLQAIAGATVAAMLLVPPTWTVVEALR